MLSHIINIKGKQGQSFGFPFCTPEELYFPVPSWMTLGAAYVFPQCHHRVPILSVNFTWSP